MGVVDVIDWTPRKAPSARVRPRRTLMYERPSGRQGGRGRASRSEEHTSELQSRLHLVCRLLLEKKKKKNSETTLEHKSEDLSARRRRDVDQADSASAEFSHRLRVATSVCMEVLRNRRIMCAGAA